MGGVRYKRSGLTSYEQSLKVSNFALNMILRWFFIKQVFCFIRLYLLSIFIFKLAKNKSNQDLGIRPTLIPPNAESLEVIKGYFARLQNTYSPYYKLKELLMAVTKIYESSECFCVWTMDDLFALVLNLYDLCSVSVMMINIVWQNKMTWKAKKTCEHFHGKMKKFSVKMPTFSRSFKRIALQGPLFAY